MHSFASMAVGEATVCAASVVEEMRNHAWGPRVDGVADPV